MVEKKYIKPPYLANNFSMDLNNQIYLSPTEIDLL